MKPLYVRGHGLWTPGYASPAAWCRGDADPEIQTPKASTLSGSLRRRATALTRMAVEAQEQAVDEAGCDAATMPSIWATVHGEHETAIAILTMMRQGEGKLSPTHFHNSVYNTASGYASIAASNRTNSTTISGGREIVAATFLEAFCRLEGSEEDVVLVFVDEPLRVPFNRRNCGAPLAIAFCLSTHANGARAMLSGWRREEIAALKPHEHFGDLYVSAAIRLLERIVLRRPGTVALEFEGTDTTLVGCVDLELLEQS